MQDSDYLKRCIALAQKGGSHVRPNPQVGAVVVYDNKIIGEGYHARYGGPHAEVNAINSVIEDSKKYLSESTIYVSLEPCCHFGLTPPCTDLIIRNKLKRVCIAELDPTFKVNQKGVNRLITHGVEVDIVKISDNYAISEFIANQIHERPFIQLKFAKSSDHYIGKKDEQVWLSSKTSNIFTHKLRAYTDGILVGTNTALIDNPSLTLRNYPGNFPKRILLDRSGRVPESHDLLSDGIGCILITENLRPNLGKEIEQVNLDFDSENFLEELLKALFDRGIHHLIVEGGAKLLKSFLKANLWDEAVIIECPVELKEGIKAPNINGKLIKTLQLEQDNISIIRNA